MAKRKRTKSGRFAKSRSRSVKRRSYKVRARRNPARRYGPSTRKGQVRKTARRAYVPKRRARRNPKGMLATPAVKYSLAAAAGFAAASYADTADPASALGKVLNPQKPDGSPLLPFGLKGSVLAAVITFAAAQWGLKGQNKQFARAAAVGMLAPSAISMIQNALSPAGASGGAMYRVPARARVHQLPASRAPAASFAHASRSMDNCA